MRNVAGKDAGLTDKYRALQKESDKYVKERGSLKAGSIAVTGAGDLEAKGVKRILHAVGPIW